MFSTMTSQQVLELCKFSLIADKETRSDLIGGYIANEDDYTSNFTGELRRIINSHSSTGLTATSFVLKAQHEQLTGCDAAIIISSNKRAKFAMFEAKMPRFATPGHRWDYAQTATGLSHFSDQLQRQSKFWPRYPIFEMFQCEYPFCQQPKPLKDEVSSCTWHDATLAFDSSRSSSPGLWSQADLNAMLHKGNMSIGEVLLSICQCHHGDSIEMWGAAEAMAKEFSISGPVLHIAADGAK